MNAAQRRTKRRAAKKEEFKARNRQALNLATPKPVVETKTTPGAETK